MKERSIIFNAEEVLATLEGRKTQIILPVKPQPEFSKYLGFVWKGFGSGFTADGSMIGAQFNFVKRCPYGKPGDRLWVRETWSTSSNGWIYKADGIDLSDALSLRWKPSIHMPRRGSRLTLEIVQIRMKLIQDINSEDARKIGIMCPNLNDLYTIGYMEIDCTNCKQVRDILFDSWDAKHNGIYQHKNNPWVWQIDFNRVEGKSCD